VAFVREEAAFLAERESVRLRELGSRTLELPSWRRRHKMVRVQSRNVYSVLIQVSRASTAPNAALLGRVEVRQPGVDGWWNRFASDFEITEGVRLASRPTLKSWPSPVRWMLSGSIALAVAGTVLVPFTMELGEPTGTGCVNTDVDSTLAVWLIGIAYLLLAAVPVYLQRSGLAGPLGARTVVGGLAFWVGWMAVVLPASGTLSAFLVLFSLLVLIPALVASFFAGRDRPTAAPGVLRSVTILTVAYYGVLYLVSPHPVVLC
jgi:hypothetical protein